jgi:hypothetical protein
MFIKKSFGENKFLVELEDSVSHDVYEPLVRKIGGVWNNGLNGWLFDYRSEERIDHFLKSQNSHIAEKQNKEFYTKFVEEPNTYNTPCSSTSSTSGLNEAFELIQELFDRIADLEKTVGELSKRLKHRN